MPVECKDEDGSLILKGRLPAEIGALEIRALDAAVNDSPIGTFPRKRRDRKLSVVLPNPMDPPPRRSRIPALPCSRVKSLTGTPACCWLVHESGQSHRHR
jgi:hypothetical protein